MRYLLVTVVLTILLMSLGGIYLSMTSFSLLGLTFYSTLSVLLVNAGAVIGGLIGGFFVRNKGII